tara:strand:+ start:154 stop:999 length:846 start_codon:yes stop_codon:yes gene_type:complete
VGDVSKGLFKMALNINGRMKVKTLKANFLEEFGLTLRVYDRRSFADPEATLASIRKGDSKGGEFSPRKNTKVGNLEDKIFEMFGLKTQVSGSDDRYLCDNDLTLNTAQQEDEKKIGRKELKKAGQEFSETDNRSTFKTLPDSLETPFDSDYTKWQEIANKAFNWYFNTVRKDEDHDKAQEYFIDEIHEYCAEENIELENVWHLDLEVSVVQAIIQQVGERILTLDKEQGYEVDREFYGILHSYISNCLYEASEQYGESTFKNLTKFIDEELPEKIFADYNN